MAQSFLDRFVRQNIAEIDEIPWAERAVRVQLPAAERALYVELKNHLEALDMKHNAKSIKSKCKSENDRESRLAQVAYPSAIPKTSHSWSSTYPEACQTIIVTPAVQLTTLHTCVELSGESRVGSWSQHLLKDQSVF